MSTVRLSVRLSETEGEREGGVVRRGGGGAERSGCAQIPWLYRGWLSAFLLTLHFNITVEPRSTDTRSIQTPGYYRQFRLSRREAHTVKFR